MQDLPRIYLVDTNIFLEVMLSQNRKEECKKFLSLLRNGRVKGIITDFTIHSIMVLMSNLKKLKELEAFLKSLTAYKGLSIYMTSLIDEIKAIELAEETGLDIDDAILYAVALSIEAYAILSFDKDFDNLKVPRKEPMQIIGEKDF